MRLMIGTRKGAFFLKDGKLSEPLFLGNEVHHVAGRGKTILLAARTGHLGPTLYRSPDGGRTWKESRKPPTFAKRKNGRSVHHTFWLTPAGGRTWYAGTSPPGLFRSRDDGATWEEVKGFNDHPKRALWCGDSQQSPPGGSTLHSILVDPRDPDHLYLGISGGGVFESTDRGRDWKPLNRDCELFFPDPKAEYGHDPHCMRLHPRNPDRLWQQNHCGIYRMDRSEGRWVRVGKNMPKTVGDIGFPMALHPRDPDAVWVLPMDGTSVWPRTSPGGRPSVYSTRDAGKTWKRLDRGLPKRGWLTVYRQAMTVDPGDPVGIYFGTSSGEVWGSRDEGRNWKCLARHLPVIQSLEVL